MYFSYLMFVQNKSLETPSLCPCLEEKKNDVHNQNVLKWNSHCKKKEHYIS